MKRLVDSSWMPVAVGLLGLTAMLLLAFFWYSFSPVLGKIYTGIRMAETLGAWKFTYWGDHFINAPANTAYHLLALYKSSVPFGVFFGIVTGLIAVLAYRKVRTRHLNVLLAKPKGGFKAQHAVLALHGALPHLRAGAFKIPTTPLRLPMMNPFATVVDLRDRAQISDAVADLSWPETAAFVMMLDAIAPMENRTRIQHVFKTVWQAVRAPAPNSGATAEPKTGAEPSIRDRTMMTLTLIDVVTRLDGRTVAALDDAHLKMHRAKFTHDALSELTVLAQTSRALSLRETAWLRFADPLLHDRIAHAGLGDNA